MKSGEPRRLLATYRLQLHQGVGFDQAAALVPYLHRLGISHLYLSPVLEAAANSSHGYDVVDHSRLSSALGGAAAFERLVAAAHRFNIGLIVDIVPNHMSIADPNNHWWWEVLENGPAGLWAHAFDVDWNSPERRLKNVVLLPVLGDHRSRLLEKKEIAVRREGGRFIVEYQEHRFPLAPPTVGSLLQQAAKSCASPHLAYLGDAFFELPRATAVDAGSVARRHRDKEVLRELFEVLLQKDRDVALAVDDVLAAVNADPEQLDGLLERQNYRLAYWRAAERDLDYRRFFDINTLVGLNMGEADVFFGAHELIGRLVSRGDVDGLRVDHVDGLANPRQYLERLRSLAPRASIHVEKILAHGEELRAWPIEGTTGYEFISQLTQLMLDPRAQPQLTALAHELAGVAEPFEVTALKAKGQVLRELLLSDLSRLANVLFEMEQRYHELRDYGRHELKLAIAALASAFDVYRTYVEPESATPVTATDRDAVVRAVAKAKEGAPNVDAELFDLLQRLLLAELRGPAEAAFVQLFQQLTVPTMAKGLEDTAFYRDARLLALDEVGHDPTRFGLSVEQFHQSNAQAVERWPHRLLATSTHDTKRSEDARARLVALSHRPEAFAVLARSFYRHASRFSTSAGPGPHLTMVALQSMVAVWPADAQRLESAVLKSAREAKLLTSWSQPNEDYEAALQRFVHGVMRDEAIRAELDAFVLALTPDARTISLGWALLKCMCPGVPDFYQGCEAWSLSLVDPDNRRPVDWAKLAGLLEQKTAPALTADEAGASKLQLIRRALALRHQHPRTFGAEGRYLPLIVSGEHRERVVALARVGPGHTAVAAVTRYPLAPGFAWGDTELSLPEGDFESVVGPARRWAGRARVSQLFLQQPVALLST